MREHKKAFQGRGKSQGGLLLLRLQSLSDPSISEYIARTAAKYGKYSLPIEEVRKIVDTSMGSKTLNDVLREMREGETQ